MNIRDVAPEQMTAFFLSDPKLCYMGLCDEDLANLYYNKEYTPSDMAHYQGIYEEDSLIAVIKFEKFSIVAVNVHLYIKSSLHGKKKTIGITDLVCDYLRETTSMTKVLIMAPSSCEHSSKAALARGFVLEGTLTKACVWRQEVVDVLIYALEIKR